MALQSWIERLEIEPDGKSKPYDIVTKEFSLHFPPTEKEFPNCCEDHFASFKEIKKWANDFLPEEEAVELAKKTLLNFANTEGFILFNFNEDDWYEEISDFIEFNIFSFGSSINHAEGYLMKLGGFIKSIQIPNNYHKSRKLAELVLLWLKNSMFSRDLYQLRRAFDKWFYSFPFELSFLSDLKDKYDLFFGIVNDDFTDFDDTSFMVEINKMTDAILYHHNTSNLFKQGLLNDPSKVKFELIKSKGTYELNNENFYGQDSDSDPEYIRMIQKWFVDEIEFVDNVIKHLPNSLPGDPPSLIVEKSQQPPKDVIEELPLKQKDKEQEIRKFSIREVSIVCHMLDIELTSEKGIQLVKEYTTWQPGKSGNKGLYKSDYKIEENYFKLDPSERVNTARKDAIKNAWELLGIERGLLDSKKRALAFRTLGQYYKAFINNYQQRYKKVTHK